MNYAVHECFTTMTMEVEINTAVPECFTAITVEVEINTTVHECSSAITVALKTNTEHSTHNPPGVCVVQEAPRSGMETDAW